MGEVYAVSEDNGKMEQLNCTENEKKKKSVCTLMQKKNQKQTWYVPVYSLESSSTARKFNENQKVQSMLPETDILNFSGGEGREEEKKKKI